MVLFFSAMSEASYQENVAKLSALNKEANLLIEQ